MWHKKQETLQREPYPFYCSDSSVVFPGNFWKFLPSRRSREVVPCGSGYLDRRRTVFFLDGFTSGFLAVVPVAARK